MGATQCQADENLRHSLSTRFRSERKGLEALLNRAPSSDALLALGQAALRGRSERLAAIVSQLRHAARKAQLSVPITELAPGYLHMHANRLLRSAHRAQELVLYDFLCRLSLRIADWTEVGNA